MEQTYANRQRRSIWTAIASAVFGFLGLNSLLNLNSQTNQDHHLHDLEHDLRLTSDNQRMLQQHLVALEQSQLAWTNQISINYLLSGLETSYLRLEEQVLKTRLVQQELHQHQLSPFLVSPAKLHSAWSKLQSSAHNLGGRLAIPKPTDIYQMPVSALFQSGQIIIFAHIPVVPNYPTLTLFHLEETTLLLPPSSPNLPAVSASIAPLQPFLGINDDHTETIALSHQQLQECWTIQRAYFCSTLKIQTKPLSCVAKLYLNQLGDLTTFCPIQLRHEHEVFLNQGSYWLGYSSQPLSVLTTCTNGSHHTNNYHGSFSLPYSRHCQHRTPNHLLKGNPSPPEELFEMKINLFPHHQNPIDFNITEDDLHHFLRTEAEQGHPTVSMDKLHLLKKMKFNQAFQSHDSRSHWYFTFSLALSFILLSLGLILCTFINFRNSRPQ